MTKETKAKALASLSEIKAHIPKDAPSSVFESIGFLQCLFDSLSLEKKARAPRSSLLPIADFEAAYEAYPRKVGKSRGLAKAANEIRDPEEIKAFYKAIENYKAYVLREKTAPQYIKHFSTFVGEWRDWASMEAGTVSEEFVTRLEPRGIAEILAEEKQSGRR